MRNGDSINVNGVSCGSATVTNTDAINVTDSDASSPPVTIDLAGGPFAPGATDEGDGSSEIEFVITFQQPSSVTILGTPSGDYIDAGVDRNTGGTLLNLNGNEAAHDSDVSIPGLGSVTLEVDGRGGPDVIDLAGDPGVALGASRRLLWQAPVSEATANGGSGNDTIDCPEAVDTLIGGRGRDTVDCSNVLYQNINIQLDPSSTTTITGGTNDDLISGFENAVGGSGRDFIVANDPGSNALHGGPGDDVLGGGGGDDLFDGGPDGTIVGDEVVFDLARAPVSIDLEDGVATGDGNDTLVGIEGAVGTKFDDSFTGVPGQLNPFYGLAGNDQFTLDPADVVFGGDGTDTITAAASLQGVIFHLHAMSGNQFQSIERVVGSEFPDRLFGAPGSETILGLGGADDLEGKRGGDTLRGGTGPDALDGGMGTDTCRGGPVLTR